jgi:outer membrane protein
MLPCCCLAQPSSDPARQATQKDKTGTVSLLTIINSTQRGKRILKELEDRFAPKKAALRKRSEEILELRKKLSEQGANLTDDERKQLSSTLEEKTRLYLLDAELGARDYLAAENSTVAKLSGEAIDVIEAYAKANGYAVIFDHTNTSLSVLWVSDKTSNKLKLQGKPMSQLQEEVLAAYPPGNATSINQEIIKACDAKAH